MSQTVKNPEKGGSIGPAPAWRKIGVCQLKLADVRLDGGTQCRADGVDAFTVKRYANDMKAKVTFDPIDVFRGPDDRDSPATGKVYNWLAHGYHRYHAMRQNGTLAEWCNVYDGSRRDAVLFSAGCNADHGRQRTTKDIRHAVRMLLSDPEWWHNSVKWIAEHCKVQWNTANRVKEAMVLERQMLANGNSIDFSSTSEVGVEDDEVLGRNKHGGIGPRKKPRQAKVKAVTIETETSEIARIYNQIRRSDKKYVRQCLTVDMPVERILGRIVEAYYTIPSVDAQGNVREKVRRRLVLQENGAFVEMKAPAGGIISEQEGLAGVFTS